MHFSCKEEMHLVNIIFRNRFFFNAEFSELYEVQCYEHLLSDLFEIQDK